MSRSNWGEWSEPDLSHIGSEEAAIDCDLSMRRRSVIPDPLTIVIAAESGHPILMPIFGLNGFTPKSPCPHRGPIRRGSPHYCPVCHDTGLRDHPMVSGDCPGPPAPAAGDPIEMIVAPQIKAALSRKVAKPKSQTRKQRRAQKFRGTTADVRDDAQPAAQ